MAGAPPALAPPPDTGVPACPLFAAPAPAPAVPAVPPIPPPSVAAEEQPSARARTAPRDNTFREFEKDAPRRALQFISKVYRVWSAAERSKLVL